MLNFGNIRLYMNGKFIRGSKFTFAIRSAVLMTIPGILLIVPTSFVLSPIWLEIPLYILVVSLLIASLVSLSLAAVVDPGIIPGRELQEKYLNQLYDIIVSKQKTLYSSRLTATKTVQDASPVLQQQQMNNSIKQKLALKLRNVKEQNEQVSPSQNIDKFIEEDPRCLFKKSRAYQILNSTHHADRPLIIFERGFKFAARYCATCRFYRPLRSSHSSKSNACIQRYDHFCQWIGTDVCLHNHAWFYLMMIFLSIYNSVCVVFALLCMVMAIIIPAVCGVQENTIFTSDKTYVCKRILFQQNNFVLISSGLNFTCLLISVAVIGMAVYILYSLLDLIKYHHMLLETGSLTKEDQGQNNFAITAPFSLQNVNKNFKLAFDGVKQQKLLERFITQQEQLINMVKENQFINSFDSLGRILKMNGIYGFDNLIVEKEDLSKSTTKRTTSMRFSVMALKDEDDDIEPQKIEEHLKFEQIITARDSFEFAIMRARKMVQISSEDYNKIKAEHPEYFAEKENKAQVKLAQMCQKDEKTPKEETQPKKPMKAGNEGASTI